MVAFCVHPHNIFSDTSRVMLPLSRIDDHTYNICFPGAFEEDTLTKNEHDSPRENVSIVFKYSEANTKTICATEIDGYSKTYIGLFRTYGFCICLSVLEDDGNVFVW